jgi:hypothetical protein
MPEEFLPIGPPYANKPFITKPIKIKPLEIKEKMPLKTKIKIISVLVVVSVLLGFLFLPQTQGYKQDIKNMLEETLMPRSYRPFPLTSEFNVQRTITIQKSGGSVNYVFNVPYPSNISQSQNLQSVVNVTTEPMPTNGIPRSNMNMIWNGTLNSGSLRITINYRIIANTYKWDIKPGNSGSISDIPNSTGGLENLTKYIYNKNNGNTWMEKDREGQWTGRWKIEPTNPLIKEMAFNITQNKTNVLEVVESIYNFIALSGQFKYSTASGELKSAIQTWNDKNGDCDDQSTLFASLLRALGIPAWLELGALYNEKTGAWIGHGWLNVYIPLKDKSAVIVPIDVVNYEFLFRDAYRFTDYIDDGSENGLENYYVALKYSYVGKDPTTTDIYSSLNWTSSGTYKLMADEGGGFMPTIDSGFLLVFIGIMAIGLKARRKRAL